MHSQVDQRRIHVGDQQLPAPNEHRPAGRRRRPSGSAASSAARAAGWVKPGDRSRRRHRRRRSSRPGCPVRRPADAQRIACRRRRRPATSAPAATSVARSGAGRWGEATGRRYRRADRGRQVGGRARSGAAGERHDHQRRREPALRRSPHRHRPPVARRRSARTAPSLRHSRRGGRVRRGALGRRWRAAAIADNPRRGGGCRSSPAAAACTCARCIDGIADVPPIDPDGPRRGPGARPGFGRRARRARRRGPRGDRSPIRSASPARSRSSARPGEPLREWQAAPRPGGSPRRSICNRCIVDRPPRPTSTRGSTRGWRR